MGKRSKSQSEKPVANSASGLPFLSGNASIDPALASLFEQSAGPVKAPLLTSVAALEPEPRDTGKQSRAEDENEEPGDEPLESDDEVMQEAADDDPESESPVEEEPSTARSRKRKRAAAEDLEESYMRRVAKEEREEEQKRRAEKAKRQKVEGKEDSDASSHQSDDSEESDAPPNGSDESEDETSDKENEKPSVPMHESQSGAAQAGEVQKSSRTVFLGNVSTEAIKSKSAKKTLLKHLGSFLSSLPESTGPHKVESIRFRSTPFTSPGHIPKRASYARKEILDDTTPSTNAYAIYSTAQGARKAQSSLNGTVVLDRHLRVDSVAHPSAIDHKRCVFVGNLDFVDQENSAEDEGGQKKKKSAKPADIEEGLWRVFKASTGSETKNSSKVESVRVIRDRATRVGKGFAYVQFYDQNGVEEALLLDGKKFPPMLPRKLRVVRAKKPAKKNPETPQGPFKGDRSLQGRAGKLLGKAGAAKMRTGGPNAQASVVFEGHRATEGSSRIKVKTKSRGSKGKPKTRSSQRAAAYKAAGGRKEKSKK